MPWRGPEYEGEFPSLGWQVADWIETHCVIPDRDAKGQPFILTDEQVEFLVHHYRLKPDASVDRPASAWVYRRSQLVRPQKWGKSPLTASTICAEAVGPVRFGGLGCEGGAGWCSVVNSADSGDGIIGGSDCECLCGVDSDD